MLDNHTTVTRHLVLLPVHQNWGYGNGKRTTASVWRHARTFVRIESKKERDGVVVDGDVRMWVSSLTVDELTPEQWLLLARRHWAVENNNHNTLDTAFAEDDRPWITASPEGVLAVMVLRRMAYTLLALFRSVTQRSEEARGVRWKPLLRWVRDTLVAAREEDLRGLRRREYVALG